jgi:hypothetical protein
MYRSRRDLPAASRTSPRAILVTILDNARAKGDAAAITKAEAVLAFYDAREAERVASFAADCARIGVSL